MSVELATLHHRCNELGDIIAKFELRGCLLKFHATGGVTGKWLDKQVCREHARPKQRASLGREAGVCDCVRGVIETAVCSFEAMAQLAWVHSSRSNGVAR